jgi:hypothetical protein
MSDAVQRVEKLLLAVRQCGKPSKRHDWLVVVIQLIRCNDEVLEQIHQQCRPMGCGWIYPVVEEIMRCLANKTAHRNPQGIIVFPERPKTTELGRIFQG